MFTRRNVFLLCSLAAVALVSGYWLRARNSEKPKSVLPGAIQSIAVLPLANLSGDASQDYFADGMTDALITELSQIKRLRVISRTSVMQYKLTQKPLQDIAQELNVDAVVEGSVVRAGKRVRISAKLFQTHVEGALWADNFERDFTDVLTLQSDVATAIARGIQVELSTAEASELARSRTVVPEAYEAYLKGKFEADKRTQEGFLAAEEYFQKAIVTDTTFAAAYAALGATYLHMANYEMRPPGEVIPKAKDAINKALQLDEHLAEAHTSLAATRFYDLETNGIEAEFQRAIALNPGYAQGLHVYSLYLAARGRKQESLTEIKLAREFDPRSLIINANVAWCYYLGGDFDKAIEAARETLRLDPSFGVAYGYLSQAYLEKGQFREAIEAAQKNVSLEPGNLSRRAELASVYARAGRTQEAQEILQSFHQMKKDQYISPYDLAMIYAGLRDKEKTLAWLEQAYKERNGRLVNLQVHPEFAFLRGTPRFEKLLAALKG